MFCMKKFAAFLFAASAFCVADAQVVAGASFFDQIVSDWHAGATLDVSQSAALSSDLHDDGDGRLGSYSTTAALKFQGVRNRHAFDVSFGYSHSYYDFSAVSPFSDVNTLSANAFYSCGLGGRWSAFGVAHGSLSSESGAGLSDGGRLVLGGGAGYAISESLSFGLGVAAVSRMDNEWLPLPCGYLKWQIDERWSLRAFDGVAVIFDAFGDGSLLFNASCEYTNANIRLTKSAGGVKRSVSDNTVNMVFGATYNFGGYFYVSGSVGANVYRRLIFRYGGHSAEEFSADIAPVFFVHAGCKF